MRFNYLSNVVFFGLLLIIAGALMIINYVFKLDIPIFKIILGLFFIYLGVRIAFGSNNWKFHYSDQKTAVFSDVNVDAAELLDEYAAIFSNATIDLTTLKEDMEGKKIEISAVFGSVLIKVKPDQPIVVKGSAVFGSVTTPDKHSTAFGEYTYHSASSSEKKPIYIDATAVFGSVTFKIEGDF